MKNVLKYLGVVAAAVVGLFIIFANCSAAESRFQCSGEISSDGNTEPATLFVRFSEYRRLVGLWSDSDGSVNLA